MCGIAGILRVNEPIALPEIKSMTDILRHRGPDGEGCWINADQSVGLGHRRLSIIDLSENASQPMHSKDGRLVIIFNGEIYNYIELKEQLLEKGYTFHSNSDTEVLLNLYLEKGAGCLQDLDGMFAFVIWDNMKKELFCARDRFGEKPFYYYYEEGKQFVFASEIKALFKHGIQKVPNEALIFNFFQLHYRLSNVQDKSETFYRNIHKLPGASYLIVSKDCRITVSSYWDINWKDQYEVYDEKKAVLKLKELFHESLKRRLRSDVPIGSSLSGGLDSSAIVCWIDKYFGDDLHSQKTFSARFENHAKDEGRYMEMVQNHTNTEAHYTWPDENKLLSNLDALFYHQDEPFTSTSMFAQWEVMKLAKQNGVTVLIDGQGADEIFAGYHPYYRLYINYLYHNEREKYATELNAFKEMHDPAFTGYISRNLFYYLSYVKTNLVNFIQKKNTFLKNDFIDQYKKLDYNMPIPRNLNHNLYLSLLSGSGLEDLLRYGDRTSMAFSLEVRLPFLYHKLAEFIFKLPDDFKVRNGWTKYILRKTIEGTVPDGITWRKDKIGYETPQGRWLEQPKVYDLLNSNYQVLQKKGILKEGLKKEKLLENGWQIIMAGKLYT